MANTLTGLIPSLYAGLDTVAREAVGLIPAVNRNSNAERAAVGEAVTYPITPAITGVDVAPSMQVPEPTDRTIATGSISITKTRAFEFGFVGEEALGLNNGPGYNLVQADLFAQAVRGLVNEVESDLGTLARTTASSAIGAAGTTPFASGIGASALARKAMIDAGSPQSDLHMAVNTTTGANLRSNLQLTQANTAGTDDTLRRGVLLDLNGFAIRETGAPTINGGSAAQSGYLVNGSLALGATTIPIDTGSAAINAGDVFTIAGDTTQYVATNSVTGAGNLTIARPGLRVAPADNAAITFVGAYNGNALFHRQALQLVMRAPALEGGDDAAVDSTMLQDPVSGLILEVRKYTGYRKTRFEVAMAWGADNTKPEFTHLLLG